MLAKSITHPNLTSGTRNVLTLYLAISGLVFLLMMVVGLGMRMAQAEWLNLDANVTYQLMTMHGVGMVGIAGLASSAVMWFFLSRHIELSTEILVANLIIFLIGLVLILGAIIFGQFAAGWTFLYPLPAHGVVWSANAAGAFLLGLLLIGVGFLLLYLDVAWRILKKYGSLGKALGWPRLFGKSEEAPPPAVVASTMVFIVNILGIIGGAVALVLSLITVYLPSFVFDPLLVKNLIFFFGHIFINATIYQAVIAVYEILPEYTHRPWKANRVFLAAWTASTLMVATVYPHHLLMDFAMPQWALIFGQIVSYTSGFPILVVTVYGALALVYRSGIRWDIVSGLLFLSMFGWAVGVIPAIVDGTIIVNSVMHNTQWVPGHFHTYLLLGCVAMVFGFMYYIAQSNGKETNAIDTIAYWFYALGGVGFIGVFLFAGKESVPRRWAVHAEEWVPYDRLGSFFGALIVIATLIFVIRFLSRIPEIKISTA